MRRVNILLLYDGTAAVIRAINLIGHTVETTPRKIVYSTPLVQVGLVIRLAGTVGSFRVMDRDLPGRFRQGNHIVAQPRNAEVPDAGDDIGLFREQSVLVLPADQVGRRPDPPILRHNTGVIQHIVVRGVQVCLIVEDPDVRVADTAARDDRITGQSPSHANATPLLARRLIL